jgi:Putative MetA-pathway of phenol degradation
VSPIYWTSYTTSYTDLTTEWDCVKLPSAPSGTLMLFTGEKLVKKLRAFSGLFVTFFSLSLISVFAQQLTGPCTVQSGKLACVIPQEYGVVSNQPISFNGVLYSYQGPPRVMDFHPGHFASDFSTTLSPLTGDIARQANLLPLASPSSGVLLTYDPSLKTFVVSTDSLGPILGERGDTIGRHKLFLGFSYQYFNFDQIDGINLRSVPAVFAHRPDSADDTPIGAPNIVCNSSPSPSASPAASLNGCAFVRDAIATQNSIALTVNQYTGYITFGLTRHVDVSMVIPFETVRFNVFSNATIILGSDGSWKPTPGSPDSLLFNQNLANPPKNGNPYFFHLFKDCPNTSPAAGPSGLAPQCLNQRFPDPNFLGSGSSAVNSASGIGDVVARVKWNAWSGEHVRFSSGLDVRFPSGDALNFLGSGSYGVKPFVVLSYKARVSPHVMVGYEWNSNSILTSRQTTLTVAGAPQQQNKGLTTGEKGFMPSDFLYTAGFDAGITKWLTGAFDIVGARFLRAGTESVTSQPFLAPCNSGCTVAPSPNTVSMNSLLPHNDASYSIDNASIGVKIRPLPSKASKLVLTANVLVRLDDAGLHSKPAPLVGLGYTF